MNQKLSPRRRALSLLLALTLILGMLPPATAVAAEGASEAPPEHWAASYLNQMVEWGFIRADQAQNPDRALTRADFMSIVNRAYGYHEVGVTPFEDVSEYDWFYDDVGIAYNAGYIKGTSPTTASPNNPLNRETATTILGRNMMLQESPGELLDFSDARDISNWARGTIKSSMEHYLVNGYDDGTFRPQQTMNWGEIAALVTRTIGTPLQDEGDYSLGGVFGNVTVTSPGVTLRDTVISGDLYITGGVGLGGIKLENVTVLGRIIASGTGSSEGGASILLRNVTADELLIDNLQDKEVSIQADGITEIGKTTVRTSAFIQDNTPDGLGLHLISLEGDYYGEDEEVPEGWEPPRLTLAGRIEEVVNKTPNSTVHAAKGTVAKLTVDEAATGSHVVIDRGAVVKNLILDTGVDVTGEGDIGRLEVNAPGCDVEMLPDEIVIRPGITAIIAGEEMDSATADEFLLDPMILAGYPKAQDIAPTSLEAVFATNKKGRIYWAVSAITDGSIGADDLIKPPSYGNKAVRWGTLDSPRGNEETTAQITGLEPNGSYYLSAVLEDAKGQLSPVKVISFTTPDNTVPAFNAGYPHMSKVSPTDSVVVVSPNKDCKLYYALLPKDATPPTENELKTNAVAGALGYGVRDVQKNVEDVFRVNDQILKEKTEYILYLWLVDANGANKSQIVPLPFTTDDETPPEFVMGPEVSSVQATSVGLRFRLNEDGIVYWVAVPAGTVYPKPQPGTEYDRAPLTSDYAKLQVSTGMNVGSDGKFGQVTAKELIDGTINVTGLKPEQAYDFYYVAKDNAGPDRNYSVTVGKMTINTLDNTGPKFSQFFSKTSGTDDTIDPLSNTDIYLDVNENVRYSGDGGGRGFLELYEDIATGGNAAINKLAANLYGAIKLHKVDGETGEEIEVGETHSTSKKFDESMTIDYTQATVTSRNGGIRITFPASGLHLENGSEYYFTIEKITDTSNNFNPLAANNPDFVVDFKHNEAASAGAGHHVPPFVVEFARVWFADNKVPKDGPQKSGEDVPIDFFFRLRPESTSTTAADICYDILLWFDSIVEFDLYYRIVDDKNFEKLDPADHTANLILPNSTNNADDNYWIYLGNSGGGVMPDGKDIKWSGKGVNKHFNGCNATNFPSLNSLDENLRYEFVISLTKVTGREDRSLWSGNINLHANVAAGQSNRLHLLTEQLTTTQKWEDDLRTNTVRSIGRWTNKQSQTVYTYEGEWGQIDTGLPGFFGDAPKFTPDATGVEMILNLESKGTVHYAITDVSPDTKRPTVTATRRLMTNELDVIDPDTSWVTQNSVLYVTLDKNYPPTDSGELAIPNWMRGIEDGDDVPAYNDTNVKDVVGGGNLIDTPKAMYIARPETWTDRGKLLAYDSVPCSGGIDEKVNIQNLSPNTDYFVYFVIENGSADLSHVYIFHFKTEEVAKPQINLDTTADGGDALIWTHIPSEYAYRVFTADDIAKLSPFYEPFSRYIDSEGKYIPDGLEFPDYYMNNREGGVMTVLDALVQEYQYGNAFRGSSNSGNAYFPSTSKEGPNVAYSHGASVFDIYANDALRERVDEIVRQYNSTGNSVDSYAKGTGSIRTGGESGEVTQKITPPIADGTTYVILVVANAPGEVPGAERDGFRAYANLRKNAGEPPNLENATSGGAPKHVEGTGAQAYYSGTIYLDFDKDLYYKPDRNSSTVLVLDGTYFTNSTDGGDAVVTKLSSGNAASRSFRLDFSKLKAGGTINVTSISHNFANSGGEVVTENMTVTLERFYKMEPDPNPPAENPNKMVQVYYLRLHVVWGKLGDEDFAEWYFPGPTKDDGWLESDLVGGEQETPVENFILTSDSGGNTPLGSAGDRHGCDYTLTVPLRTQQDVHAYESAGKRLSNSTIVTWDHDRTVIDMSESINRGQDIVIKAAAIGTTVVSATVQSTRTLVKKIYVTVPGELTGIAMRTAASDNIQWDEDNKALTLKRDATHHNLSANFAASTSAALGNTAMIKATSNNPDISCEVDPTTNIITVTDTGKGAAGDTATITVDIVSKDYGQSLLTDTTKTLTFTVKIEGNDSNAPITSDTTTIPDAFR